jgi:hypothetical protein
MTKPREDRSTQMTNLIDILRHYEQAHESNEKEKFC